MSFKLSNITSNVNRLKFNGRKNAPMIMTLTGIAGLVGTTVLAYRAKDKVRTIVEETEYKRSVGEEVNQAQVVGRVGLALAPTVLVGTASILSILGSYHVLTNRNSILASALTTAMAENRYIKKRIQEQYPDANLAPIEDEYKKKIVNEDGKKETVTVVVPKDGPSTEGVWFHLSSEYVEDDHTYNQTFISTKERLLSNKLTDQGWLTINDVLSALGIETTLEGALLGWTDTDFFDLEQKVNRIDSGTEMERRDIYIAWSSVRPIFNNADYSRGLENYWD